MINGGMDRKPWQERLTLDLIVLAVIGNGLVIIIANLLEQLRIHNNTHISELVVTLPLISGLTLVYLGLLLHRRKRAAWAVVIPVYMFVLGSNLSRLADSHESLHAGVLLRNILLPLLVVVVLLLFKSTFTVKSNIQSFRWSLIVSAVILCTALAYGVTGFMLLDKRDFKQELSLGQAVHYTIDQLDLTTGAQLEPHTKRATYFIDSLNLLTVLSLGYIVVSLFQPIRARFSNQAGNRQLAEQLLRSYSTDSEDFFKLWPHDKTYFLWPQSKPSAAMAYRVQNGVALVVGDPLGNSAQFGAMLASFSEFCRLNDWLPAFVHVSHNLAPLYGQNGFQIQNIGQEAVLNIEQFQSSTVKDKYFRQIQSKFAKHGYSHELLTPPHNNAVLERLREISDAWLELPGRQERGFMMGYFSADYMQLCPIVVARDAAGTIQAFMNQVPTYQKLQANFDLLRQTPKALGNVNDYLLMAFIEQAHKGGFREVNLGLCPLAGVGNNDGKTLIDSTLRFVYANGDRFYSFSGLRRFKAKYQPDWQDRVIAYRGGVRGFSRTVLALNKAMNRLR